MPPGKRITANFVGLFYEQALIDIYQRKPIAIKIEDEAPIHRSKVAKKRHEEHSIKRLEWPVN